jgi:hypothetical protein
MPIRSLTVTLVAVSLLVGEPAEAAPPALVSVGHLRGHPSATWTLPPGVQPQTVEVATEPFVASDGSFFTEYVKDLDLVSDQPSKTTWLSAQKLDPGRYYIHVSGLDEPCFYAGQCPVREWSNVLTLEIPRLIPKSRYEASVVSTHPNAIRVPGSRKWTYRGDTIAISFRNSTAFAGTHQPYRVCWTGRFGQRCRSRSLFGRTRDTWRMRLLGNWVGYRGKRYVRYIEVSWRVGSRDVARRRIWVYE